MSVENAILPITYNNNNRQHRNPHPDPLRQNQTNPQRTSHNDPRIVNIYADKPPRNSDNSQHTPRNHDVERQTTPLPVSSTIKNHFIAASGEFVGTFMFLFFGFATHLMAASQAQTVEIPASGTSSQTVIFIALGYGFSLLVTVWVWYRISGGLFNPAVTLGLVLSSALPPIRGLIFFPAQILGAICSAAVVSAIFPEPISGVNTTLRPGTSVTQGLFIEMFLTCLLVVTVLMLAVEKSNDTFIAPVGIGLALFVAEIAGVFYTGGCLNPARSFGPAVASAEFPSYHWIYWLGPCLGALVTAGYFRFVKWLRYEEANPGQDSTGGGAQ